MRLLLSAALMSCALIGVSPYAYATGNVLLPQAPSSPAQTNAPAANLGLTPPAAPAPADANSETPFPPTPPQTPATPQPQPIVSSALPQTSSITQIYPGHEKELQPGTIPTYVVHQPDNSVALAQATANLPYSLVISISGQSIYGAKDLQTIEEKIGLKGNQISKSCIMSVGGILQTSKGSSIIDGGLSPQITVHYDGMITGYMMNANALCIADKLPPGAGFITETSGHYLVPLQAINCAAPNRQVSQLVITYDGLGIPQCAYQ